eukprot:PhF_6_TR33625/c0_g1_i2/m.49111
MIFLPSLNPSDVPFWPLTSSSSQDQNSSEHQQRSSFGTGAAFDDEHFPTTTNTKNYETAWAILQEIVVKDTGRYLYKRTASNGSDLHSLQSRILLRIDTPETVLPHLEDFL